eukprot:CAMPEP_0174233258 /NCGR_PEP_ID=MMETSP0417-20130205/3343_1 /TAXON_ID=242541 /ORGANISM="Mayorella sp, Strain BSH-02190019" /LENGTH=570 /DNA_ID=CAMNT_0015311435 /DNA_START=144 /DNA_END=1852 /DNA_ORIENTATION=+
MTSRRRLISCRHENRRRLFQLIACALLLAAFVHVSEANPQLETKIVRDASDSEKSEPIPPLFTGWLALGTILCLLGGLLCSGGGVGGGAFYLPVFILILQLDAHIAVALSKVTIFGVALGGYAINFRKRHPNADRPLIDYAVATVMEPMTLCGTILGVMFNVMSPAYLIVVFLVVLLSFTSYKTFRKAYSTYKAETAFEPTEGPSGESFQEQAKKMSHDLMRLLSANDSSDDMLSDEAAGYEALDNAFGGVEMRELRSHDESVLLSDDEPIEQTTSTPGAMGELVMVQDRSALHDDDSGAESFGPHEDEVAKTWDQLNETVVDEREGALLLAEREQMLLDEANIPWVKFGLLGLVWLGMVVMVIFKGGSGAPSIIGVECGSWAYWLIIFLMYPYLIGITGFFAYRLYHLHLRKIAVGFQYLPGDIQWTQKTLIVLPSLSTLAGVAAGFLGIGGGMVKGPLMLHYDMIPQVASATSAFMIIFTSSSTTIQFLVLGRLPLDYALWYFCVGFVAAVGGHLLVAQMLKRYKKQSYVAFLLGGCIATSAVVMTALLVYQMIVGEASFDFNSVCSS